MHVCDVKTIIKLFIPPPPHMVSNKRNLLKLANEIKQNANNQEKLELILVLQIKLDSCIHNKWKF